MNNNIKKNKFNNLTPFSSYNSFFYYETENIKRIRRIFDCKTSSVYSSLSLLLSIRLKDVQSNESWCFQLQLFYSHSLVAAVRLVSQKHDETQWKGNLTSLFNTTVYDSDPFSPTSIRHLQSNKLLCVERKNHACRWEKAAGTGAPAFFGTNWFHILVKADVLFLFSCSSSRRGNEGRGGLNERDQKRSP